MRGDKGGRDEALLPEMRYDLKYEAKWILLFCVMSATYPISLI